MRILFFSSKGCKACPGMLYDVEEVVGGVYPIEKVEREVEGQKPPIQNRFQRFGVRSVPTTILIEDGEEIDRIVGAVGQRRIAELIFHRE